VSTADGNGRRREARGVNGIPPSERILEMKFRMRILATGLCAMFVLPVAGRTRRPLRKGSTSAPSAGACYGVQGWSIKFKSGSLKGFKGRWYKAKDGTAEGTYEIALENPLNDFESIYWRLAQVSAPGQRQESTPTENQRREVLRGIATAPRFIGIASESVDRALVAWLAGSTERKSPALAGLSSCAREDSNLHPVKTRTRPSTLSGV
jgi:hypothetical protein